MADPSLEQLVAALQKADAAGDVGAAQAIAAAIKQRRSIGTVTPNVVRPGETAEEYSARLIRENPINPVEGMSGWQRFAAGAGKAIVDTGRGLRQLGAEGLDLITGGNRGAALREEADRIAAQDAPLMDTGAGLTGNIAGTAAAVVVPAGGVARGAQALNLARTATAARALANPATYRAAAATGAVMGAAQPVGTDESRALNTAIGAGAGAAGRAVTGVLAKGATALGRAFEGPKRAASRLINEALERANITPREAIERLAELGPDARLVDLDESLAALARTATGRPGQEGARTAASDFLEERAAGRVGRLFNTSGLDAGDGVTDFKRAMRSLAEKQQSAARELYQQAYESPLDLSTEKMQSLLSRPRMQTALKRAERVLADEGIPAGPGNEMRLIDAAKRVLDDSAGKALKTGAKGEARRISAIRNELLAEVDKQVPAYAQARATYAGEAAVREAGVLGRKLFTQRIDLDDAEEAIAAMGEGELAAFQRGALRSLVDRLEASAKGQDVGGQLIESPRAKELMRLAFPDKEALERMIASAETESRFARTRSIVKSPPAGRLDEGQDVLESAGIAAALARGDYVRAAGQLLKKTGIGKVSDETVAEVSRLLFGRKVPGASKTSGALAELAAKSARGARAATVSGSAAAGSVGAGALQ